jgi:hypothetical protein
MFVLSVGMPKSGSTLFSWYQKDILQHAYPINGQEQLQKLISEKHLNGKGHFVQDVDSRQTLEVLCRLGETSGPFIVKTHTALSEYLQNFLVNSQVVTTFIHRDPRDVILSIIDHGIREKLKLNGDNFFSQYNSIRETIPLVKFFCDTAQDWVDSGIADTYSYSSLLREPKNEIFRFCQAINYFPDDQFVQALIEKYTLNPEKGTRQFNTGKLSRYREEMTKLEIELCNNELREQIINLQYIV